MARDLRLTALQGDTLDLLIWRDAGLGTADLARVMDANPGIADFGPILPAGTTVIIPSKDRAPKQRPILQLWD